jgi:hypothetical protein
MFFDWSKVKPMDMWQYENRVNYLKEKLDSWNKQYGETGVCPVDEREYMGTASELYYYWKDYSVFQLMDKKKLMNSVFFPKVD